MCSRRFVCISEGRYVSADLDACGALPGFNSEVSGARTASAQTRKEPRHGLPVIVATMLPSWSSSPMAQNLKRRGQKRKPVKRSR